MKNATTNLVYTYSVAAPSTAQKEIAIKEFDLNNQNSPLASIVNQNISEKKREVIKSNAPKGAVRRGFK